MLVGNFKCLINCKDHWLYIFGLLNYNLHWFCKAVIFALSAAHTLLNAEDSKPLLKAEPYNKRQCFKKDLPTQYKRQNFIKGHSKTLQNAEPFLKDLSNQPYKKTNRTITETCQWICQTIKERPKENCNKYLTDIS